MFLIASSIIPTSYGDIILGSGLEQESSTNPGRFPFSNEQYTQLVDAGTDIFSIFPQPWSLLTNNEGIRHPGISNIEGTPPTKYLRPVSASDSGTGDFPSFVFSYVIRNNVKYDSLTFCPSLNVPPQFALGELLNGNFSLHLVQVVMKDSSVGLIPVMINKGDNSVHTLGTSFTNALNTYNLVVNTWDRFVNPIPSTPVSPEYPGPTNSTGGGQGTFDNTSTYPGLTPLSFYSDIDLVNSQYVSAYVPTKDQFTSIAQYLWSSNVIDALVKLVPGQDPMKYILGCHTIPLTIEQLGSYVISDFSFGLTSVMDLPGASDPPSVRKATTQFVDVTLGRTEISLYSDTFADYSPYANYSLFLPYIGIREISADIINTRVLTIMYRIDIVTGSCVAYILDDDNHVLYSFSGNCASQLPITGENAGLFYASEATLIAGAGLTVSNLAYQYARHLPREEVIGSVNGEDVTTTYYPAGDTYNKSKAGRPGSYALKNTSNFIPKAAVASGFMGNKVVPTGETNIGGNAGLIDTQTAYLIRILPNQSVPSDFRSIHGYMSNVSQQIGNFAGLTQFSDFHLEGIPALPEELSAIASALQEGVIL